MRRTVCVALVLASAAACSASPQTISGVLVVPPGPAAVTVESPVDGAVNQAAAAEISLAGPRAAQAAVTVTDATGAPVAGALRGLTWVPASTLRYGSTYHVVAVARNNRGRPDTSRSAFTTMARPAHLVGVRTVLADNQVYGVGMPVVVNFEEPVPVAARAAVSHRLLVDSDPPQEGAWRWFSPTEAHYRPKEYWQEGTKLSVRLAVGGQPLGAQSNGSQSYGAADVTVHATIAPKLVMTVDDTTKTLTVAQRDQVLRTLPVSLGKPGTPSSSGAMVVMTKMEAERYVSTAPGDRYDTIVYWSQRLTWGGEYLHAAPWSVADQGVRDVSHGCTNMSTENAKWLFGLTHVGDPVIVRGTAARLDWGNGWTDWDRPWAAYVADA